MIGDDQIDVVLTGDVGGGEVGDAAIDGYDQPRVILGELFNGFGVEAIAFVDAMGDIELDLGAGELEAVPEDGDAGDAIDVIVAIEDDFLFLFQGGLDSLYGGFDSAEAIGFNEVA